MYYSCRLLLNRLHLAPRSSSASRLLPFLSSSASPPAFLRPYPFRNMSTPAADPSTAMDTTPSVSSTPAPAASAAPADSTSASSSAAPMELETETVYCCTLYGLTGWDGPAKIEKRLNAHDIKFKKVEKKKGVRETEATLYFENEEVMKDMMAKMAELREAPTAPPKASTAATTAAATVDTAAASASSSSDAPAPAPAPVLLTRQLFKVRAPLISLRKKRSLRSDSPPRAPRVPKGEKQMEFRAAKRMKVELKEGEVGYKEAEAAAEEEEARSASEGEGEGEEGRSSSPTRSGRVSPTHFVEASINDIVAPLWRKPYPEQLVMKRDEVKKLMQDSTKSWKREYGKTISFQHESVEDNNEKRPLFCPLDPIVPSPILEAYRNKCEFSIGLNSQQESTIGHLMGKYTEGTVTVESIQQCPHVPSIAKSLSATLTAFIREFDAEFTPYDKRDHTGFWRLVIVRNSQETKQCMLLIQVSPKGVTQERMQQFREQLLKHFEKHCIENPKWKEENEGYDLKALQLQLYEGVSNAAPEGTPIELLYGKEACIYERLMGLDFRVSQSAFFQINVPQTNVLYSLGADFAQLPPVSSSVLSKANHILLDVCCGTGTIGLSLANRVGKVVGLEMSAAAVEDAKFNAQLNGISNAHYYVGKAEDTLGAALNEHVGTANSVASRQFTVTAIVDPPRSGLHADVVRLLRKCPRIDRIVYISCNPKSLMENLQRFLQPPSKKWSGPPFTARRAIPVDMFPSTTHCEMVVLLEREKQEPPTTKFKQPTKVFAHQMKAPAASTDSSSSSSSSTAAPIAAATSEPVSSATPAAAAEASSTSAAPVETVAPVVPAAAAAAAPLQ